MAETYDLYFGTDPENLIKIVSDTDYLAVSMPKINTLDYDIIYYWRVDATNDWGTTEGDVWYFTTTGFRFPAPVYHYSTEDFYYYLLPDGTPPPTGVEGTDYIIVYNPNFIRTTRRLICATKDSIFYGET